MKNSNSCSCCGKPLSDPISLKYSIGPVCRVNLKIESMKEKSGNLFANEAEYDYWFDGNVVAIEDLGGMKSVTNDMENILFFIQKEIPDLASAWKIMYKDSMGIWDGVEWNGCSVTFFSLNETEYDKALEKLHVSKPKAHFKQLI